MDTTAAAELMFVVADVPLNSGTSLATEPDDSTEPAGRAVTDGEIAALLRVCRADPSPAGPRDAAILRLGTYGTLRREEIARLPFDA